jgi:hypothetical protein
MKLVDTRDYNNVLVKRYSGKRKKGKQWFTVNSVIAESLVLGPLVEFGLVRDSGKHTAAIYFKEGWSETKLFSLGIVTEEEFNEIVLDAETALLNYKGIVVE